MWHGVDMSNFTELEEREAEFVRVTQDFVCIGLQNSGIAAAQKGMLYGDGKSGLSFQYYSERVGRDLSLVAPGEWVWVDIEKHALEDRASIYQSIEQIQKAGGVPLAYCNRASYEPVFGESDELAKLGIELVYADYRPPAWESFQPFAGWLTPRIWQYSDKGLIFPYGDLEIRLNVDLLILR